MSKVSVIVVIYNSQKYIKPVFDAIFAQTHKDLEVLAVICGNDDGSKEFFAQNYSAFAKALADKPQVKILDPGKNLGFSAANNLAIREASGEFIQLVNPDLILEPNYIEEMIKAFGNPKVAAVTGKLLRYDFTKNQKTNIIDSIGIVMSISGRARDRGQNQVDSGQFDQETEVFGVSGAGPMYRRNALEKVKYCEVKSNCVIIHGCPSKQEDLIDITRMNAKHWIPWLADNLRQRAVDVQTPLMPEAWAPDYTAWKKELEKLPVNEESILVGHSCACSFLVRWLGETKIKIKKLILVGPAKIPAEDSNNNIKDLYTFEIDSTIKDRVSEIKILVGENEKNRHKQSAKIYADALNGQIIIIKNRGHFTFKDMGTNEFPELFEEILRGEQMLNCEYFDEDFFMYWEDVDLSWRLKNIGYVACYVANAVAYHGRTAGQAEGGYGHLLKFIKHHKRLSSQILRWNYKNHLLMYVKNAKHIWHPAFILRELAMLGYIIIFETSTLKVIPELFRQIPKILRKRKAAPHGGGAVG